MQVLQPATLHISQLVIDQNKYDAEGKTEISHCFVRHVFSAQYRISWLLNTITQITVRLKIMTDYTCALQKFLYLRSTFGCAISVVSWCFAVISNLMMLKDDIWRHESLSSHLVPSLFWGKVSQTRSKSRSLSLFRLGPLVFIWMGSNTRQECSLDSLLSTLTPVQS